MFFAFDFGFRNGDHTLGKVGESLHGRLSWHDNFHGGCPMSIASDLETASAFRACFEAWLAQSDRVTFRRALQQGLDTSLIRRAKGRGVQSRRLSKRKAGSAFRATS